MIVVRPLELLEQQSRLKVIFVSTGPLDETAKHQHSIMVFPPAWDGEAGRGVGFGEQPRKYLFDIRKKVVFPSHSLRLVAISYRVLNVPVPVGDSPCDLRRV